MLRAQGLRSPAAYICLGQPRDPVPVRQVDGRKSSEKRCVLGKLFILHVRTQRRHILPTKACQEGDSFAEQNSTNSDISDRVKNATKKRMAAVARTWHKDSKKTTENR